MPSGDTMRARRDGGFTYLGLIILVAVIGLVGAATLKIDALLRRARAEEELLAIGAAFGEALRTYAEATPKGQPAQPPSLKELLKDPRFPGVRRHLRKIFVDPMTGKAEWGIVWTNPGDRKGVLAVYSLSTAKPLKIANFDARFAGFENKEHVSDWKFAAMGQTVVQGQMLAQQPSLFQPQPNGTPAAQPSLFPAPGSTLSDPARPAGGQPIGPVMPPPPAPPPVPVEPAPADAAPAPPPSEASGDGRDERDEPPPAQDAGR
ncbi:type II secretion system GspH family protein [Massilia pinisoli]|uniref:Type II secretion system GspH family protein n=1 Tax=Massilia pinisoli TaxID=1772194 RepID=A0ABT1ZUY8_9BURK|nr:type II secretion system protein [Massilia pinisoli]MCS0583762.1 type II secretion system GspH family protein [Massilia pinisoli]